MKIGRFTIPTGNTMVALEDIELTEEELMDVKDIIDLVTKPSVMPPAVGIPKALDCDHSQKCIDHWSEKCNTCANNRVKSYYEEREVE